MTNIILIILGLGIYMLPFIIGVIRKVKNITRLFVLNFLLGWTIVCWIIALVWATAEPKAK